ncbi:hypothetical protein RG47T_0820 [Mucilaginibacter polytrichastri]|uniref:Uncharacterized protein n=1 Tax=Mucilaginibacter polytrichastri TaxID=1302689 RepID=A0A1Q5ZUD7_9SPHI|nr:hypothetical protein RG47T_0820 [Mucilaginibacter polytrichastri]
MDYAWPVIFSGAKLHLNRAYYFVADEFFCLLNAQLVLLL